MNKTQVFASFYEFLNRENQDINGVSAEFAADNPGYEKDNKSNKGCWNCSDCSGCSDCSDCSGCSRCSGCSDCSGCSRCSDCSGCSRCSDCSGCSRCSDCSDCSGCSGCSGCSHVAWLTSRENLNPAGGVEPGKSWFDVPVIPNIHQTILKAVSGPGALDMKTWHTCDTTHCRAGWAVHLAGERGRKLEAASSTLFAAMQIYHASNPHIPVSPVRFFETDQIALADMKRCAEEEAKAPTA